MDEAINHTDNKETKGTESFNQHGVFNPFDVQGMSEELQRKVVNTEIKTFERGRWDGSLCIKVDDSIIKSISQTFARRINEEVLSEVEGKLDGLNSQHENEEKLLNRAVENDASQHQYKEYLEYGYRYHPRSFSKSLLWLYFLFGIFLLLADIPLSVQLIQKGFRFPQDDNYALDKLMSQDFFNVLFRNWQVFLTAFGISLCTVFIKIMYDDYVATPFGNKIFSKKKFFAAQRDQFTAEEIRDINREEKFKTGIKFFIFFLTLATIIWLGVFRVNTIKDNEQSATMAKMLDKITPGISTDNSNMSQINEMEKTINGLHSQSGFITALAFILITILFPLISGICFSLALNCAQSRRRLRRAKEVCEYTEKEYLEKLSKISQLVKERSTYNTIKKKHEGNWAEKFADELVSIYMYGHQIGRITPNLVNGNKDFLTLVEHWRNNSLSHRTNVNLLKITEN